MRAYQSLLRLARMEVDARSRVLKDTLDQEEIAKARIPAHDAMVEAERLAAQAQGHALMAYGAFFQRAKQSREALVQAVAQAQAQSAEAREALAEALTEQKKIERLIELAEERQALEQAQQERRTLDEAATMRFARSGKSAG